MKKIKKNNIYLRPRNRRQFLLFLSILPTFSFVSFSQDSLRKNFDSEELIIIDGWILKKGDLVDL